MKYFKTKFDVKGIDGENLDEAALATARELCAALAGYAGYESFEDTPCGVDGYVQQETYDAAALNAAFAEFPLEGAVVEFSTCEAENRNWNEEWEKNGFDPIIVNDRCMIHDIYHTPSDAVKYPITIEIDAKQAFGTGTHNTTQMIVAELLDTDLYGKSVLDCGCGTGILSIVSAKCGTARVAAYDIDEWSVENTRHNAVINNVANIDVLLGDAKVLDEISETFDVVLANINRNILLNDMPAMVGRMNTGAYLVISGFYAEDVPMLKEKADELNLDYISMRISDNWTLLKFRKL